jgi:Domain of unknown function (DUF4286)
MIVYNVTVSIDADAHEEWLHWMKTEHIPDVMATGLFLDNRICRVLTDDPLEFSFAIQYTCADMATYEIYKAVHAPVMQRKHSERYDGKFAAFRTLLEVVHTA